MLMPLSQTKQKLSLRIGPAMTKPKYLKPDIKNTIETESMVQKQAKKATSPTSNHFDFTHG